MEPLFFMALGYAGFLLFQEVQTRRRARTASSEEVCGHTVLHHRAYTHSGFRATRNVELEQNVTTIQGMLPDWVHFGWPVERRGDGAPRDANALWIEIILGPAPLHPEGGTVVASNGDLTFETRPAAFPPSSRGIVEAARPRLERKPDVVAELIRYVDAGLTPSNAVAFRILSRSCPDKRPARELARRHRDHADPGLAAAIAELEYPRGRERLSQRHHHPGCAPGVGLVRVADRRRTRHPPRSQRGVGGDPARSRADAVRGRHRLRDAR